MRAVPPDEERCTAATRTGTRCLHHAWPGETTCAGHADDGAPVRPLPERRCAAHSKKAAARGDEDTRCPNAALHGQTVCGYHGGNAPHSLRAAEHRAPEWEWRVLMDTYGLPVEIGPQQAMLAEVHRVAGHVAWLEQRVHALDPDALTWGVTRVKEGGDDRGTTFEAVPHALLALYQAERDRLVRVCAAALRAGVEERQVKLAEAQGSIVAQMIRAILGDLDLSPDQQAKVAEVVPRHLRAVTG